MSLRKFLQSKEGKAWKDGMIGGLLLGLLMGILLMGLIILNNR
jgi:hypothetical protein